MSKIKGFLKAFADSVFPEKFTCDICGIEIFDGHFCKDCLKQITFNSGETCPVCGRKTPNNRLCLECKAKLPAFKRAVSPLVYEKGAIPLIAKFKNGQSYLKEYFAELICAKLNLIDADCIVYVPMTKDSEIKRGYNQAKLLAESISQRIGIECINGAILKIKDTPEQKSLSKDEREKNLEQCFKVADVSLVKGKNILLVDDVLTTGATAEAITKKFLKAKAKGVYLATVVSVEYKPFRQK